MSARKQVAPALGLAAAVMLTMTFAPRSADARPTGPRLFCATYPDAPSCQGRLPACTFCHTSTSPPAWNAYGQSILESLTGDFDMTLGPALAKVEHADSDGDGVENGVEIRTGTAPGNMLDVWLACGPKPEGAAQPAAATATPGEPPVAATYDFSRAYTRVLTQFCGRSPTYDEKRAFDAAHASRADLYARLHTALGTCLASPYWRDEGLPRLADPLIRPIGAVSATSNTGVRLADFDYDYRLFSYVLTGDRDARDLLTAKYHVQRAADGSLVRVEGVIPNQGIGGGQPLDVEHRAGMITTQWFLVINTMFSDIPRTTAAQAYRAYLGQDIARQEGIFPIADEPRDIDKKGVTNPDCSQCHSTLDPLSYAFSYYEGISGKFGSYNPDRPRTRIPTWPSPTSYLLGKPVDGVVGWAKAASESDFFKRTIGGILFRHAVGRDPLPEELSELEAAWKKLPEDGYSANRFLARVVDNFAFGRP